MSDERISPAARQLLLAFFDHDLGDGDPGGRRRVLRGLLKELEDAHYVMRGDSWKSQTGGHLLVFDRYQEPTIEMRLPPMPPGKFGRDVLYVIGQPGTSIVKIGVTQNVPSRLKNIQTGSPVRLAVRWWHVGSYDLERTLHDEFQDCKLEGEWFDFGVEEPELIVESAVERLRSDEFPPPIGIEESFEDYFRKYPPGCRYTHLLNLSHGVISFPRQAGDDA